MLLVLMILHCVFSELIVVFLKFLLDHDPIGELLEVNKIIEVDV